MSITLDHIVLPAHDQEASARLFAQIIGVEYAASDRHMAPVALNSITTIAFTQSAEVRGIHVAFHVSEERFEAILANLQAANMLYGDDPREPTNLRTEHPFGGKGVYFSDANGHFFEVMTVRGAA